MEKSRFKIKQLIKYAAVVCGGIILGTILMILAYCIPINETNKEATLITLEREGICPNVPVISDKYDKYFTSYLPGVLDNNTVSQIMWPQVFLKTAKKGPVYTALNNAGYNYYWHGYAVVLRTLQTLFNYEELQIGNELIQILLMGILAYIVGKKKGMRYILLLLSGYALIMPMAVALCVQYTSIFYITYFSVLLIVKYENRYKNPERYLLLFLIAGMCTSYFDLLTYPLFTWGIPFVWLLLMDDEGKHWSAYVKKCISTGVAWIAGYAGMWAGKWVIGSIVLKENIVKKAFQEIFIRTGADSGATYGMNNRFYSLLSNWKHYNYKIYELIIIAWLIYIIAALLIKGYKKTTKAYALGLAAFSGIVWYVVLSNHTGIHHFFTYRIYGVTIAAVLALGIESIGDGICAMKTRILHGALGLLAVAFSLCLANATKELCIDNNYVDREFDNIEITEPATIRIDSELNHIYGIGIGIGSESTTGEYIMSLYEDEELIDEIQIPVEDYAGVVFKEYNVDWKLSDDKNYLLTVTPKGTNRPVYMYYTRDELPLKGISYMADGIELNSQPLLSLVTYQKIKGNGMGCFMVVSYVFVAVAILLLCGRTKKTTECNAG